MQKRFIPPDKWVVLNYGKRMWSRFAFFVGLLLLVIVAGCSGPTIAGVGSHSKIVAFGDSLTAGYGASEEESYPAILSELLGVEVSNYGISGEDTSTGLERIPEMLADEKPTLVLLCMGGNDMLREQDPSQTKENLDQMISLIRAEGSDVILVGVPKPGLTLSVPKLYKDLAKKHGLPLEAEALRGILKKSSLKSDTIHPNAAGYRVFAEALLETIDKSAR